MPKVVYSDSKGLVQEAGTGFGFVTGTVADKVGLHLYQEEVEISANANADKVISKLSKVLPANSVILQASITTSVAAGDGVCALKIHSADLALGVATNGTEIVGENVASNVSTPDDDLDLTTVGSTIATNSAFSVGSNVYLHITSKVGAVSLDGTTVPKVVVSILYVGKGEPA